jgi:hypothetical protein
VITSAIPRPLSLLSSSAGQAWPGEQQWWTPGWERLRQLSTSAINTHTNGDGRCRGCGRSFPCPDARLAEAILEGL